ncbi:unnamed protein product [Dovyalis caffra]|uniref:UDP-N-acetylglucosamine transferase subunit ALG14 n=1 Tax=Dovyalis caffra TaxID=77055 RepID=A0AAV1SJ24_9ROSI|nr:unnamed protein product [Dovyalis caffra]
MAMDTVQAQHRSSGHVLEMQEKLTVFTGKPVCLSKSPKPLSTLIVLGSGGHTAEMINVLNVLLQKDRFCPRFYIAAGTDNMSLQKACLLEENVINLNGGKGVSVQFLQIYRSREVGQSYITSVGTTLLAMVHALWLMIRIRPQVVLCNGPGTCVPLCLIAFLFKVVGIRWSSVFYVESIARVRKLSLSGLLLYKLQIADQFFLGEAGVSNGDQKVCKLYNCCHLFALSAVADGQEGTKLKVSPSGYNTSDLVLARHFHKYGLKLAELRLRKQGAREVEEMIRTGHGWNTVNENPSQPLPISLNPERSQTQPPQSHPKPTKIFNLLLSNQTFLQPDHRMRLPSSRTHLLPDHRMRLPSIQTHLSPFIFSL